MLRGQNRQIIFEDDEDENRKYTDIACWKPCSFAAARIGRRNMNNNAADWCELRILV